MMVGRGRVIVVGGEKGGTGKTMLATNLAVCFAQRGKRVKLIDADEQGSSYRWATKRVELGRQPYIPCAILRGAVMFGVREEAAHYDVIIVDAGGADSIEFESACAAADYLLSPIVPSDCDLGTMGTVNDLVARLMGTGQELVTRVVLNNVSTHPHDDEAAEARVELAEFQNLPVATSHIHVRKPFRQAFKHRFGVIEGVSEAVIQDRRQRLAFAKPSEEIWALFREMWPND